MDEPVNVMWEGLHMHRNGISAYTQHFRNGQLLRTARANYFEFDQQGIQLVAQHPYQILPGDSFRTTCFYRNDGDLSFGPHTCDEMCMGYLFYYPRMEMSSTSLSWHCGYGFEESAACSATWANEILSDTSGLNRTFGLPATKCEAD